MNTLENTIPVKKNLQETGILNIFPKPMSRDDFMKDIETAEQQILNGKYHSAKEVFYDWKHRYKL